MREEKVLNQKKVIVFCLWTAVSIFSRHDFSPMWQTEDFDGIAINVYEEKSKLSKDKEKGFIKPFFNYPDEENFILLPIPAIFYPPEE